MQLQNRELTKGLRVWYQYSKYATVYGPFIIQRRMSNHQGDHVVLKSDEDERTVLLADDDDYGELIFYDDPPKG